MTKPSREELLSRQRSNPMNKGGVHRERDDFEYLCDEATFAAARSPRAPHKDSGHSPLACQVDEGRWETPPSPRAKREESCGDSPSLLRGNASPCGTHSSPMNYFADPSATEEVTQRDRMPTDCVRMYKGHRSQVDGNTNDFPKLARKAKGVLSPPARRYDLMNGRPNTDQPLGDATPSNLWSEDATRGSGKQMGKNHKQFPGSESAHWPEATRTGRRLTRPNPAPAPQSPRGTRKVYGRSDRESDLFIDDPRAPSNSHRNGRRYDPKVLESQIPLMVEKGVAMPGEPPKGELRDMSINATQTPITEAALFHDFHRRKLGSEAQTPWATESNSPVAPQEVRAKRSGYSQAWNSRAHVAEAPFATGAFGVPE